MSTIWGMSSYYPVSFHGLHIHSKARPFFRRICRFCPYLTGTPIRLGVTISGKADTGILASGNSITFFLKCEGKTVPDTRFSYPSQEQYELRFDRVDQSGRLEVMMEIRIETGSDNPVFLIAERKIAKVYMIENWRPFVAVLNIVAGAIIGGFITWLYLLLSHR